MDVSTLEVYWPTSGLRQTLHDVAIDGTIEITERSDEVRVLESRPVPLPRSNRPGGTSARPKWLNLACREY
jgi:hypothetical protein